MPVSLTEVTAWVESDSNIDAMRVESALVSNNRPWISVMVPKIAHANGCSLYTARTIACTSFGLFQILGANIYRLYNGKLREWWSDAQLQENTFTDFARCLGHVASDDVTQWSQEQKQLWAMRYNGLENAAVYVQRFDDKIQQILKGS